jgi:hypothetical protein
VTDRGKSGSFPSWKGQVFGTKPFAKGCLQFLGNEDVVIDTLLESGKDLFLFPENGQGTTLSLEDRDEKALNERALRDHQDVAESGLFR